MKTHTSRRFEASSPRPFCSKTTSPNMQLVYIRYRDHLLFKNLNPDNHFPSERECVGWVWKETSDAVWILWDRSVTPLPYERVRPRETGLVILKSDILEVRELDF